MTHLLTDKDGIIYGSTSTDEQTAAQMNATAQDITGGALEWQTVVPASDYQRVKDAYHELLRATVNYHAYESDYEERKIAYVTICRHVTNDVAGIYGRSK